MKLPKKDKSEVHYSSGTPTEHCGNCRHFLRPDGCERVRGVIDKRDWCDLWAGKIASAKAA